MFRVLHGGDPAGVHLASLRPRGGDHREPWRVSEEGLKAGEVEAYAERGSGWAPRMQAAVPRLATRAPQPTNKVSQSGS